MSAELDLVRQHLREHFATLDVPGEPDVARVTFVGAQPIEVLRFGPSTDRMVYYASVGCSRNPMGDPSEILADPIHGPRAEIVLKLRVPGADAGLARTLAALAAAPAVEGVILTEDALLDLGEPLWARPGGVVPFTAVLVGPSDIAELPLEAPREPVRFLSVTPISATEAAWVRLKGADALREAWRDDGVDVLDSERRAAQPR